MKPQSRKKEKVDRSYGLVRSHEEIEQMKREGKIIVRKFEVLLLQNRYKTNRWLRLKMSFNSKQEAEDFVKWNYKGTLKKSQYKIQPIW